MIWWKSIINKLPKFVKNFYFLVGVGIVFWVLFFDSNDLITQYKLTQQLKNLQQEKLYYLKNIDNIKKEREALMNNGALLEKFAREKYFMKKKTEDLYIIVEPQK